MYAAKPARRLKREKSYLGSWFQGFQSMVGSFSSAILTAYVEMERPQRLPETYELFTS